MDPVRKAVWFVESHLADTTLSLESIARACHVSPFHLTRAFAAATGSSLMRYVRARRLSLAAAELVAGAADILAVALNAGYGSHEAFTRAFREQFGVTPEQARAQAQLEHLSLVEPVAMSTTSDNVLSPPRFETHGPLTMAGLVERHDCARPLGIPNQWQRFSHFFKHGIAGQVGQNAYGVCYNFDGEGAFDYLCGVQIDGTPELPSGLVTLTIAPQLYAVFTHTGHVAGIRATMNAIWSQWLPASGKRATEAPLLEVYGPQFNALTGLGGFDVWFPVDE